MRCRHGPHLLSSVPAVLGKIPAMFGRIRSHWDLAPLLVISTVLKSQLIVLLCFSLMLLRHGCKMPGQLQVVIGGLCVGNQSLDFLRLQRPLWFNRGSSTRSNG